MKPFDIGEYGYAVPILKIILDKFTPAWLAIPPHFPTQAPYRETSLTGCQTTSHLETASCG